MQKALSIERPEMAKELRNLSDIERRAREQEQGIICNFSKIGVF
jgi:hypothetical protein